MVESAPCDADLPVQVAPHGGKWCPHCKTVYAPKYKTFEEAKAAEPRSIYVEQHMTGFCSDKCWDEAFDSE